MEKQEMLAMIQARREPLEHEEFQASLDLELGEKGEDADLVKGLQERLTTVREKLKILSDKEKEVQDA